LHRFFSYADLNNNTSNRVSHGDRNGLGNDAAQRNPNRNNLPALQNQPFVPHSVASRYTTQEVGARGCLDCHMWNFNFGTFMVDQNNNTWDVLAMFEDAFNNFNIDYYNAVAINVSMAYGLGTNLWQFDANGNPVFDDNNNAVFDLDRLVELNGGVLNFLLNHLLLNPIGMNQDYLQFADLNCANLVCLLMLMVLNGLQIQLN
jgi:hypothetical protein